MGSSDRIASSGWGSQQAPAAAAAAAAAACTFAGPLPAQLQLSRGFAAGGGSAAVRRLRRASARAAGASRRAAVGGREAALERVAAGGGEVEAGPQHDVVPHEGVASTVQVASVVDHPALIVTRPIEWQVLRLARAAAWLQPAAAERSGRRRLLLQQALQPVFQCL